MKDDGMMKKAAVLAAIFAAVSLTVMLQRAGTRNVIIADAAQAVVQDNGQQHGKTRGTGEFALTLKSPATDAVQDTLMIPLPENVDSDDVVIENHYLTRQLWVYIRSHDSRYYETNPLITGLKQIQGGKCILQGTNDRVCLHIQLDGLYEYQSELSEENVTVRFQSPHEAYDKVVVIDPYGGGADQGNTGNGLLEKDVCLQIARKLEKEIDSADVKVYFTRLDDSDPSTQERCSLITDAKADMVIGLCADAVNPSVSGMTAYYNNIYYIRGYGNADMAAQLERDCVYATKSNILGIRAAGDRYETLKYAEMPSAYISVGNLANVQDAENLAKEEYLEKIAQGILQAVNYGGQVQNKSQE